MEVSGRRAYINILFENEICHNGKISFGAFEFEIHGNAEFEPEVISLEERADWDRCFTYVLRQAKAVFFPSYYLCDRIHRFLCKSALYMNDCSNSEQFNSICLDYAYQFVESVSPR